MENQTRPPWLKPLLQRCRDAWPARQWTRNAYLELADALQPHGPHAAEHAVTQAIRTTTSNFPPSIGTFAQHAQNWNAEQTRQRHERARRAAETRDIRSTAPPWHAWLSAGVTANTHNTNHPETNPYREIAHNHGITLTDPDYPEKYRDGWPAAALHDAEHTWINTGQPPAPHPTHLHTPSDAHRGT